MAGNQVRSKSERSCGLSERSFTSDQELPRDLRALAGVERALAHEEDFVSDWFASARLAWNERSSGSGLGLIL